MQANDNTPVQSEIQQQLHLSQDSGVTGLEDITPEDYITVDSEVVVAEELTTESIVAQVQYKNSDEYEDNENDDTEEAPAVCVTLSEALASVDNSAAILSGTGRNCPVFCRNKRTGEVHGEAKATISSDYVNRLFFI